MGNSLETNNLINILENEHAELAKVEIRLAEVEVELEILKKESYSEKDVKIRLLNKIHEHRIQNEFDYLKEKKKNIKDFIKIAMN